MSKDSTRLNKDFDSRLLAVSHYAATLTEIRRGIEKESLRITPDGRLSQRPHPEALGSTLTHPNITTDYSEALLELITEPHQSIDALLQQLQDTHTFIYQNIGDELLWVNSMPCILGGDLSIPIAQYGSSNIGRMKTVYRHGLWHRYGRHMQAIAGIHFNFSLPDSFWTNYQQTQQNTENPQDFISAQYFRLIRNFQRYSWLIIYLFGASPAVCASFVKNKKHRLQAMRGNSHTFHLPYATSLRMSDLGYQNDAQSDLKVCYNSLETYTASLEQAIRTPYPPYQDIGIKDAQGYKQLNANILQIENEYYSSIRPKRTGLSGERPTLSLRRRGVEYIEVRSLDLNPFDHIGLHKNEIHFLDAFLIFCLLEEDIKTSDTFLKTCAKNLETTVYRGRDPEAQIVDAEGREHESLGQAARNLLDRIMQVAQILDTQYADQRHQHSLLEQSEKLREPASTPSGRIIDILDKEGLSFFEFAMQQAEETRDFFSTQTLTAEELSKMQNLAKDSLKEQREIEAADTLDFDSFVANYFKG